MGSKSVYGVGVSVGLDFFKHMRTQGLAYIQTKGGSSQLLSVIYCIHSVYRVSVYLN